MNIIEIIETIGLTMVKMAVIWGSCGIGLVIMAQILKAVAGEEIEAALKKLFSF